MAYRKKKILFVGSFKESTKDGGKGGQMFASRTLLRSELNNQFRFLLIDSTADSIPAPPLFNRFFKAFLRFIKFIRLLVKYQPEYTLLFASAGLGFIEKGIMAIIAKMWRSKVVFAPRSGLIKDNINNSHIFNFFCKKVISVSDTVICQGTSWKTFYSSLGNFRNEKFKIVPNWIDISLYEINRPVYNNRIPPQKIIFIGRIEEYKGIFDLLNAINIIKSDIDGLIVEIHGGGKELIKAQELSQSLGVSHIIKFMGWADHERKFQALREADMYVLPSHKEGFPNALLEAMASGIPSIATNVGGISDLVKDSETGLLVNSHNSQELAGAILRLYKSEKLRKKLGECGRQRVQDQHSIGAMEMKMKKIFRI